MEGIKGPFGRFTIIEEGKREDRRGEGMREEREENSRSCVDGGVVSYCWWAAVNKSCKHQQ